MHVVLTHLAVLSELVQGVLGMPANGANGDLCFLTLVPGNLHQLFATFFGELREHDADDRAVVCRVDAEIAVPNRLLDRTELRHVVGLDDRHARLRDVHRGHLRDRRGRAVVVDDETGERVGCRASGAQTAQLLAGDVHRLLHLLFGVEEGLVDHCRSLQPALLTSVPIFSPRTTRAMFPSESWNTMMGMLLSRHRLNAVASATDRPRRNTSS